MSGLNVYNGDLSDYYINSRLATIYSEIGKTVLIVYFGDSNRDIQKLSNNIFNICIERDKFSVDELLDPRIHGDSLSDIRLADVVIFDGISDGVKQDKVHLYNHHKTIAENLRRFAIDYNKTVIANNLSEFSICKCADNIFTVERVIDRKILKHNYCRNGSCVDNKIID